MTRTPDYGLPLADWLSLHPDDPEHARFADVADYLGNAGLTGPECPHVMLTDIHADPEAFLRSLALAGVISHPAVDAPLTTFGRKAKVVLGGDYLNKGPANLELLKVLRAFHAAHGNTVVLGGNNDLLVLMGLAYAGRKGTATTQHMFIRMAEKAMPLLREVFDTFVHGDPDVTYMAEDAAKDWLLPAKNWQETFPAVASRIMSADQVDHERKRLPKTLKGYEDARNKAGLTHAQVQAAVVKAQRLANTPTSDLGWLFSSLRLLYQAGSYLFVHAGVDDTLALRLQTSGVDGVNALFDRLVQQHDLALYYGSVGNAFRTRYHPKKNRLLSPEGVEAIHATGVKAVVHGHRGTKKGQRLVWRCGLLHVEGDTTMDSTSRKVDNLVGAGQGALHLETDGRLVAVAADWHQAKVFAPHVKA